MGTVSSQTILNRLHMDINSYSKCGVGLIVTCTLVLTSVGASASEPSSENPSASDVVAGLIDDEQLARALDAYDSSEDDALQTLVETVAQGDSLDLNEADHVSIEGDILRFNSTEDTGNEISISIPGESGQTSVVDGVAINQSETSDLESLARATPDGGQIITVIDDYDQTEGIRFDLGLPDEATANLEIDGSIVVTAPREIEQALPGEEARFEAAVTEIIGESFAEDPDSLSVEQTQELFEIPDVQTTTVTVNQVIAVFERPWAVDANGAALDTRYVLEGETLIQEIDVEPDTAFPITADPKLSLKDRVIAGASCVASIAGLTNVAVAAGKIVAKAIKVLKSAKAGSKYAKAYSAWKELAKIDGYPAKTVFGVLKTYILAYAKNIFKGPSAAANAAKASILKSTARKAQYAGTVVLSAAALLSDVVGLTDCKKAITGVS